MSHIDWSKAPEGATHWGGGFWYRQGKFALGVFNGDRWVPCVNSRIDLCEGVVRRPVAEQQLNITDFRDLRPGDIIWWEGDDCHDAEECSVREVHGRIITDSGYIDDVSEQWRFVRRPVAEKPNKYSRTVKGVSVDVYDILKAWDVTNPALQHLIKKALQCGERGHKSRVEDLDDILASAKRAKELG
ncbi:MAG: DUF1905 domain-containing protein [Edwardsiella phage MSW-3]|nr:MAG: DUF1905 domain-containing protein [Edwardsiella phage MSW-3]